MKKSVKQIVASALACVVGVALAHASTPQTLPFGDDFEAVTIDLNKWAVDGSGSATTPTGDIPPGGVSRACQLTNASITVTVAGAPNNVWGQIYADAATYDGEPATNEITGLAAVFFVDTNLHLMAMDGNVDNTTGTWQDLGPVPGGWVGYVAHLDYLSQKWDLYTTSGTAGAATLNRVGAGLGFFANLTEMGEVEIFTEKQTLVDEIGLVHGYSDASNDVYTTVQVSSHAHEADAWVGRMIGYTYSSPDNVLDPSAAAAGRDIMMGMQDGDQVRFYLPTNGGFNAYEFSTDSGFAWDVVAGAISPSAVKMAKSDTIWIQYTTATNKSLEFWPQGFAIAGDDPVDNSGELLDLYGATGSSGVEGWNHVPYGGTSSPINSSGLLGILQNGDSIYFAEPNSIYYRWYYMENGQIYRNGAPANITLTDGARLWIEVSGGDDQWLIP